MKSRCSYAIHRSLPNRIARQASVFETLEDRRLLAGDAPIDSPVLISEFMSSNVSILETRVRATADNNFTGARTTPDWIELQNTGNTALDLGGFHLTDDPDNLTKWEFPSGTTIQSKGHIVVFASQLDVTDPALDETGHLHTNFKLDPEGEYLAVVSADGKPLHELGASYPVQRPDISYGLDSQGKAAYLKTPTPGAANSVETYAGIAADTNFSVDRGFYTSPIDVAITTIEPNAQIWYTTDGTEPSPSNGKLYSTPLRISQTTNLRAATYKDGYISSLIDSQTYLFLDQVLKQDGSTLQSERWGHAGPDWEMDPEIVNHTDPEIRATADDLKAIPTVSLTTDFAKMFGDRGIYIRGENVEVPVSFEFFDATGRSVQAYSTVQIVGGTSPDRWKTDKLSMRVKFTEDVGHSRLDYPLFGSDATDSFDNIVIDARLNNVWTYGGGSEPTGQRNRADYLRDEFASDLQNALGGYGTHGHHVHVYINGIYWGLHMLHERPDDTFAATYLGGDNDDYDIMKHTSATVVDGTRTNYNAMLDAVRQDMAVPENYEAVEKLLDIDNFIDYMLLNFYIGNTDWDHHNWYASFNRADPEGRWRFHSWDAEKGLHSLRDNVTTLNNRGAPTEIHQRLSKNPEYVQRFVDRVHKHFFHDGALTPEAAGALYQARAATIEKAIRAESARWGDNQRATPYTRLDWVGNVDDLLESYFPRRTDEVLRQLQRRGWWAASESAPPRFLIGGSEQYGGHVSSGGSISIEAAEGTIYYSINGSDPRATGGEVSTTAQVYTQPIVLSDKTTLRARLRTADGTWSPLSEATFFTAQPASRDNLRISEVHYHPADPSPAEIAAGFDNSDDFEFVEVTNISNSMIDLSNVRFARVVAGNQVEGIEFDFVSGNMTQLKPGESVLVVEDGAAMQARYGAGLAIAGQWSGKLGNADETIVLMAGDEIIHEFTYTDQWHPTTDGNGPSLEIIDVASSDLSMWTKKEGWRASAAPGGSPARSQTRIPGDSNHDGRFNSGDLVTVFQAGEYEDAVSGNSTFEEGDWNGDGDFNTGDLVFAFQAGTYVAAAIPVGAHDLDRGSTSRQDRRSRVADDVDVRPVWLATKAELELLTLDLVFERFDADRDSDFDIALGQWDPESRI
jgi:hypothetical protein